MYYQNKNIPVHFKKILMKSPVMIKSNQKELDS